MLGRYDEALADLERAAVLDPTDGSIFALRGEVHCALEQYEDALDDYSRALESESRVEDELEDEGEPEPQEDFGRAGELCDHSELSAACQSGGVAGLEFCVWSLDQYNLVWTACMTETCAKEGDSRACDTA